MHILTEADLWRKFEHDGDEFIIVQVTDVGCRAVNVLDLDDELPNGYDPQSMVPFTYNDLEEATFIPN